MVLQATPKHSSKTNNQQPNFLMICIQKYLKLSQVQDLNKRNTAWTNISAWSLKIKLSIAKFFEKENMLACKSNQKQAGC